MQTFRIAALIAAAIATVQAQVVFESGQYKCPEGSDHRNYCAGGSFQTNIIFRCTGTFAQAGNCNDNLAGIPPAGVKTGALCYEPDATSGQALCAFNGVAYPENGTVPFPVNNFPSSSVRVVPQTTESSSSVFNSVTATADLSSSSVSRFITATATVTV